MDEQMRDKLHGEIMNILCLPAGIDMMNPGEVMAYKLGHRDARHAAAELVTAAQVDFVSVPVEPDLAMVIAGENCIGRHAWKKMVEASPNFPKTTPSEIASAVVASTAGFL